MLGIGDVLDGPAGLRLITAAAGELNETVCDRRMRAKEQLPAHRRLPPRIQERTRIMVPEEKLDEETLDELPRSEVDRVMEDDGERRNGLSWEAEVLRRMAPRLAELQRRAGACDDDVLGWEAANVRRLVEVTRRSFDVR
jgi:hypothetical protein